MQLQRAVGAAGSAGKVARRSKHVLPDQQGIEMIRLFAAATCLLAAGCAPGASKPTPVGLANPASTYCVEQGGKLEIRKEAKGDTGYCHLPDGKVVEEWEFFRARDK